MTRTRIQIENENLEGLQQRLNELMTFTINERITWTEGDFWTTGMLESTHSECEDLQEITEQFQLEIENQ